MTGDLKELERRSPDAAGASDSSLLTQLQTYVSEYGTKANDDAIDVHTLCSLEEQFSPIGSINHEIGEGTVERTDSAFVADTCGSAPHEPPELHFTKEFSRFYAKHGGKDLPNLGPEDHVVIQIFPGGIKRTVVQREANLLDADETKRHIKQVNRAMLEELQR